MCLECEKFKKRKLLSNYIASKEIQKLKQQIERQIQVIETLRKDLDKKNRQILKLVLMKIK